MQTITELHEASRVRGHKFTGLYTWRQVLGLLAGWQLTADSEKPRGLQVQTYQLGTTLSDLCGITEVYVTHYIKNLYHIAVKPIL